MNLYLLKYVLCMFNTISRSQFKTADRVERQRQCCNVVYLIKNLNLVFKGFFNFLEPTVDVVVVVRFSKTEFYTHEHSHKFVEILISVCLI